MAMLDWHYLKHMTNTTLTMRNALRLPDINIDIQAYRSAHTNVLDFNLLLYDIREKIEKLTPHEAQQQKTKDIIFNSAAKAILDDSLGEFVKNALDAKADKIKISFGLEVERKSEFNHRKSTYITYFIPQQVIIQISDNGTTPIPKKILGQYDWQRALVEKSTKIAQKSVAEKPNEIHGGRNLGLARVAHFLQTHGQGSLTVSANTTLKDGNGQSAIITLSSDSKIDAQKKDPLSAYNYIPNMIHALPDEIPTIPHSRKIISDLKTRYKPDLGEEEELLSLAVPLERFSPLAADRQSGTSGGITTTSNNTTTPSIFSPLREAPPEDFTANKQFTH